jgi:nucleotide-binding universal stress UspA family protein
MRSKLSFQVNGPILAALSLDQASDEVLLQADALARFYRVKLHLCHVLPEIFAVRPLFPQLHLDDALKGASLEAAVGAALAKRARIVLKRESKPLPLEIEQGTSHAGILKAAERIGAGVLVIGISGKHHGRALLGNTGAHVVRYAHCHVLVARPSPPGNVLAATDFSDPALPAIHAGMREARRRKANLTIIHALDLLPMILPSFGDFDTVPPMELSGQLKQAWQQKLDECVRITHAKGGGILREGPPATTILEAAAEIQAQLIVVGVAGRTGLRRITLGSVAEDVVRNAPCSVLAVRFAWNQE